MSHRFARRPLVLASSALAVAAIAAIGLAAPGAADRGKPSGSAATASATPHTRKAVFFAADGLRQDLVAQFAAEGSTPTMRKLLKQASATGGGLLTQAPPNTGAGWYSARDRRLAGRPASTNNTFHINGAPFTARTAAFDPGVLQAESIAQAAERGGLKVAQMEWAGGRNASIQGPTVDFRIVPLGPWRRDELHRRRGRRAVRRRALHHGFGLQFDHPAGYAGQAAFPGAAPTPATGWTDAARVVQPGAWRCACGCSTSASTSTA